MADEVTVKSLRALKIKIVRRSNETQNDKQNQYTTIKSFLASRFYLLRIVH